MSRHVSYPSRHMCFTEIITGQQLLKRLFLFIAKWKCWIFRIWGPRVYHLIHCNVTNSLKEILNKDFVGKAFQMLVPMCSLLVWTFGDCSGESEGVYSSAGVPLSFLSPLIWNALQAELAAG